MSRKTAIIGARIFDGETTHEDKALLIEQGHITDICDVDLVPSGYPLQKLDGGLVAPGYIDLQVNGGGGILFNHQPDVAGIETICAAHRQFGTTGILITLITDTPEITSRAIKAGIEAAKKKVPGFLGLHLEGPHLSIMRKGAHDQTLIRKMMDDDLAQLLDARKHLPNLMVTVATEAVTNEQIARLSEAGIIVSLGHTDTSFVDANAAIDAGALCATHLFNAMSPLGHREPGLVGAVLSSEHLFAGLIADGFHVDAAAISIALSAKKGRGKIFLVSDGMSTVGSTLEKFELNGRTILRKNGCLTLEDGTLAGADIDLHAAVRFMSEQVALPKEEALRMASLYPAQCLRIADQTGSLRRGSAANFIHMSGQLDIQSVWIDGTRTQSGQENS